MAGRRAALLAGLSGLALLHAPACARTSASARTVTHALGQTVVEGEPRRIVTLFQGATDIVLALGARPIGAVESWTHKPVYPYLREAMQGVAMIGLETQPSLEDIVHLRPDLIIASRFRNERIYALLGQIAPTVALQEIYTFKQNTALIGQALGRQPRARALLDDWAARTARLCAVLGQPGALGEPQVPGEPAPQGARPGPGTATRRAPITVSVLEFREDHVRVYLAGSFAGTVLTDAGFVWPAGQADAGIYRKLTSKEGIPLLNADVVFLLLRSDRQAVRQNYQDWSAHPLWQRLDAVRDDQVYPVDNVDWSLGGGILSANRMLDRLDALAGRIEGRA